MRFTLQISSVLYLKSGIRDIAHGFIVLTLDYFFSIDFQFYQWILLSIKMEKYVFVCYGEIMLPEVRYYVAVLLTLSSSHHGKPVGPHCIAAPEKE